MGFTICVCVCVVGDVLGVLLLLKNFRIERKVFGKLLCVYLLCAHQGDFQFLLVRDVCKCLPSPRRLSAKVQSSGGRDGIYLPVETSKGRGKRERRMPTDNYFE